MDDLDQYVKSFVRIQASNECKIKYKRLENDTFEFFIQTSINIETFIPERIEDKITKISIEFIDNSNINSIDISNIRSCKSLVISGDTFSELTIHGNDVVTMLDISKLECEKLYLRQFSNLQISRLQSKYIGSIPPSSVANIIRLMIYFSPEIEFIDLTAFPKLFDLTIKGQQDSDDINRYNKIKFPKDILHVDLLFLTMDVLDLQPFSNVESLDLQLISPTSNSKGVELKLPEKFNHLNRLFINGTTLNEDPVIFNHDQFPVIQHISFENHMNSTIAVVNLSTLDEFGTSIERFVVGHHVKLFLVNLSNIKNVKTGHRIYKYVYDTQIPEEFKDNTRKLEEIPKWLSEY